MIRRRPDSFRALCLSVPFPEHTHPHPGSWNGGTGMVSVHRDGDDLAVQLSDSRQLRPDVLRAMRPLSRAHRI